MGKNRRRNWKAEVTKDFGSEKKEKARRSVRKKNGRNVRYLIIKGE